MIKDIPNYNKVIKLAVTIAAVMVLLGCFVTIPHGKHIVIPPGLEQSTDESPELTIRWFGTATFSLQFGDSTVFTDPFFSHNSLLRTLFGDLKHNDRLICRLLADSPKPNAILVGHSHYDHLLDIEPMLRLLDWQDVDVIGSKTTLNILAGYNETSRWNAKLVSTSNAWQPTQDPDIHYRAFISEHMPQILGKHLYDGKVEVPVNTPPRKAGDFPVGDVLIWLVRISHQNQVMHILISTAAGPLPKQLFDHISSLNIRVDLAILSVPQWDKADGYPETIVEELKPRYIIPAHINNFFANHESQKMMPFIDLDGFIHTINKATDNNNSTSIVIPHLILGDSSKLACPKKPSH